MTQPAPSLPPPAPNIGRGRRRFRPVRQLAAPLLGVLILLFLIYLPTLQPHINGSPDPYAEDVAEIQTALNLGGTLHATGYPLYAMIGAGFVGVLRAMGIHPALAASLYSTVWCFVALSLFYALIVKLTGRTGVASAITLLLGLTRGVWAYSAVAKPYTMTLAFCALLLLLALWPGVESRRRVLLLALAGGFAVAHHRMIAFMTPGLLLAAIPPLFRDHRRILPTFAVAIPVALIGFLPYLYLPIRASVGGLYVYGNPTTLQGFWDEFTAKEANHLFKLPTDWGRDARDTLEILLSQMTPLGTIASIAALIILVPRRRLARTAALCGVGFLIFLLVLHRVVMPTAVMTPAVMILMFLIALGLNDMLTAYKEVRVWAVALPTLSLVSILGLIALNAPYIRGITHDPAGLNMVALAQTIPRDGVFMYPWSTRYNAVAFSKYVTGENADLDIIDHRGDFKTISAEKPIYSYHEVFYRYPLAWWDAQIGRAYLSSPVDQIVSIRTKPAMQFFEPQRAIANGTIGVYSHSLRCDADTAYIEVMWAALRPPTRDLSVFVHLLDAEDAPPLRTGDVAAPIYGWYPVTRWTQAEQITDHYRVALRKEAKLIRVGMYEQPEPGKFVNYPAFTLKLAEYDCLK
jgi:hypothetical protein